MSGPGRHHDPPADLFSLSLPLVQAPQSWVRVHPREFDAIFFGRTGRYRFEAPESEYGVLYVGGDVECTFIETFGHATGTRSVTEAELQARLFSRIRASRPLQLVDLSGPGLARLGADARLTSGESYLAPRRWALAIHNHPSQPDGLLFRASGPVRFWFAVGPSQGGRLAWLAAEPDAKTIDDQKSGARGSGSGSGGCGAGKRGGGARRAKRDFSLAGCQAPGSTA